MRMTESPTRGSTLSERHDARAGQRASLHALSRIRRKVPAIVKIFSLMFYDCTSKPPGTIKLE